jgi:hypothetical protein
LALARQFTRLVLANVTHDVVHLVIDDTVTLRASKKHQAAGFITSMATDQSACICARLISGQSGNHHLSSQQGAGSAVITFPFDASW